MPINKLKKKYHTTFKKSLSQKLQAIFMRMLYTKLALEQCHATSDALPHTCMELLKISYNQSARQGASWGGGGRGCRRRKIILSIVDFV